MKQADTIRDPELIYYYQLYALGILLEQMHTFDDRALEEVHKSWFSEIGSDETESLGRINAQISDTIEDRNYSSIKDIVLKEFKNYYDPSKGKRDVRKLMCIQKKLLENIREYRPLLDYLDIAYEQPEIPTPGRNFQKSVARLQFQLLAKISSKEAKNKIPISRKKAKEGSPIAITFARRCFQRLETQMDIEKLGVMQQVIDITKEREEILLKKISEYESKMQQQSESSSLTESSGNADGDTLVEAKKISEKYLGDSSILDGIAKRRLDSRYDQLKQEHPHSHKEIENIFRLYALGVLLEELRKYGGAFKFIKMNRGFVEGHKLQSATRKINQLIAGAVHEDHLGELERKIHEQIEGSPLEKQNFICALIEDLTEGLKPETALLNFLDQDFSEDLPSFQMKIAYRLFDAIKMGLRNIRDNGEEISECSPRNFSETQMASFFQKKPGFNSEHATMVLLQRENIHFKRDRIRYCKRKPSKGLETVASDSLGDIIKFNNLIKRMLHRLKKDGSDLSKLKFKCIQKIYLSNSIHLRKKEVHDMIDKIYFADTGETLEQVLEKGLNDSKTIGSSIFSSSKMRFFGNRTGSRLYFAVKACKDMCDKMYPSDAKPDSESVFHESPSADGTFPVGLHGSIN